MIAGLRALGRKVPAPGWMMLALLLGFAAGVVLGQASSGVVAAAGLIGGLWLDMLRMTVVPLVFALVVTGVAGLRSEAGRLGGRMLVVLAALLLLSAVVAALLVPPLLAMSPISPTVTDALRGAFPPASVSVPSATEAVRALVPVNIVASAAAGAMVPLVIFALVLGWALGRIEPMRAAATLAPLQGLADAMVVIVGAVLRVAPVGIAALAFTIGASAGTGAIAMLGHYILVQWVVAIVLAAACYAVARIWGGAPLWSFARAAAPAQAVAASTQSSLATLPAMLAGTARLGVPEAEAGVVLPLAVAVFKITAPSNALLVGLAMAWMAGVPVAPTQIVLAVPLAIVSTFAVLGMPGAVSFVAATSPAAMVLGAPLELLPVMLAVDMLPDMVRTVANVTADLAATLMVARDK
jgi:proton glutamate symport protein